MQLGIRTIKGAQSKDKGKEALVQRATIREEVGD